MSEGYLIIKDDYALKIICLDYIRDVTPISVSTYRGCFNKELSLSMEGEMSREAVPFHQITRDVGYANAYTEIHTAYQSIHDEIEQLESYKSNLEKDIKSLKKDYNQGVADLKKYETWYEKVTEFDKKSYDVWCQMMHDQACAFMGLEDEYD